MAKGFRDKVTKEDVLDLNPAEKARIVEMRRMNEFKQGSLSFRVGLEQDQFRRSWKDGRNDILNDLISLDELRNKATRLKVQVAKGEITEEIGNGMKMTDDELATFVRKLELEQQKLVDRIPTKLWVLRAYVGTMDLLNNIVAAEADYDAFVLRIEKELKERGFALFTVP